MSSEAVAERPNIPRRRRRRLAAVLLLLLATAGTGAAVGLPWWLESASGNRWMLGRLNRVFAPGRLEAGRIAVGWGRPLRIEGLTLFDARGAAVLRSTSGVLDRDLSRFLLHPHDLGTLTLDGSRLDLAKTPTGEVNLAEALGGVFDNPHPRRELTIRIIGELTVNDPALPRGIQADALDFSIRFRPRPEPLEWTLSVAAPRSDPRGRVEANGTFDRWRAEPGSREVPNLAANVRLEDWPFEGRVAGAAVSARLAAEFAGGRSGGRPRSNGRAEVRELSCGDSDASPPEVRLAWNTRPDGETVDVRGDLAAARLSKVEGPFTAGFDVAYDFKADRLDVASLAVVAPLLRLDAKGSVTKPSDERRLDLEGTLSPDYPALTSRLARRVEPNARISGEPSPWRVRGSLADDGIEGLTIEGGFALTEADLYGMKLGPTPIRARYDKGVLVIDPIDAPLNGGRLALRPTIELDGPAGPMVRLGSESSMTNVAINDEVSRRVLSFVAPVLNQATQVNGRISAEIRSAEIPISGEAGKKASVEGTVVFRDVTFAAGPFSKELLSLVVRDAAKLESPLLTLNDPVRMTIADGRITQRGLGLPVGSVARLELEGWVDFDRNLGLTASVPFSPALFAKAPILNGAIRATRISIPIGGTLDNPRIDGAAFKENLAKMGRDVLMETGTQGLARILANLAKPRDPNAPPPPPKPTAAEKKAKRLKQREERQMQKAQRSNK